jgi:invasion protein IalB
MKSALKKLFLVATVTAIAVTSAIAQKGRSKGGETAQATRLEVFGDWGAYASDTPAGKVCYAMSQPKARKTKGKNLDPAFFFITNKPRQGVRNEVSLILGFATKKGGAGTAMIGDAEYPLLTQDNKAWIKNPAEQAKFIGALRKGGRMTVTTESLRGNEVADTYSLDGFGRALERAEKECGGRA